MYSRGGAQSEVRKLHVENVIHWQVSVKGVYRRAIQQLLQVASPATATATADTDTDTDTTTDTTTTAQAVKPKSGLA